MRFCCNEDHDDVRVVTPSAIGIISANHHQVQSRDGEGGGAGWNDHRTKLLLCSGCL